MVDALTVRIIVTVLCAVCAFPSAFAAVALVTLLTIGTESWGEAAAKLARFHIYSFLAIYSFFSFPLSAVVIWFVPDPHLAKLTEAEREADREAAAT
ncbi:hypothetical protein HK405_000051, partial [Cladochytrium tenue]